MQIRLYTHRLYLSTLCISSFTPAKRYLKTCNITKNMKIKEYLYYRSEFKTRSERFTLSMSRNGQSVGKTAHDDSKSNKNKIQFKTPEKLKILFIFYWFSSPLWWILSSSFPRLKLLNRRTSDSVLSFDFWAQFETCS